MNKNKEKQAAADMCARAAVALGVVIEQSPAPSAAPEVRGAFQGLRRVISSMHLYNETLATGSPRDIENWRRDGARIRAEANERFQEVLDACLPGLGIELRLDELQRVDRADYEIEIERGAGHGAG